MALPDRTKRELLALLSAATDGRLDDASFARLESLLEQGDEGCELLLTYSRLHADLQFLAATDRAERRALARLPMGAGSVERRAALFSLEPTATAMSFSPEPTAAGSRIAVAVGSGLNEMRGSPGWRRVVWLMAVAAGVMLPLVVLFSRHGPPEEPAMVAAGEATGGPIRLVRLPNQVACLTNSVAAQWHGSGAYTAGQFLSQGDRLELSSGAIQVSMASGVDLTLEGPCSVVLLSENLVRLERGNVTAHAAKWATGFTIETRGLRVTDLGTRFAVSAESPEASEAHVLEGAVLAEPLGVRPHPERRLRLESGEAIRVDLRRSSVDRLAAARDRFIDEIADFRPFRRIMMHNTGARLSVGDVDPHWTITTGEESLGPWPQPAVVGQSHFRYSDNAPERSQWISVAEGTTKGVPPDTLYTFETTFDLSGFDLSTVHIVGQVVADNGVTEIRMNGRVLAVPSWVDNVPGQEFQEFRVVEIREGFVPGVNRLEIDVYNGVYAYESIRDKPNPMALRVEWQAFGREALSASLLPPGI